uniref:Uncharacterized protein n=1 Tax=Tanacetum cinerariifolium TaxID=118510 RepID=A0A6L2L303_TANCI|nr:hypothetical protein [Tanacetum cinerariifolium]
MLQAAVKAATELVGCCGGCHIGCSYCEGCHTAKKAATLLRRCGEAVTHVMQRSWMAVIEIMSIDQVEVVTFRIQGWAFYGAFNEAFDEAFYEAFNGASELERRDQRLDSMSVLGEGLRNSKLPNPLYKLEGQSLKTKKPGAKGSMDLDSFKDDQPIQVSSEDAAEDQTKTKDTSVPQPPSSPKSIKIQELTNQVLLLQSHKYTLEKEKVVAEAEIDIPAKLVALPTQVSSIHSQLDKLKVLDAIPTILGKVVATMDRHQPTKEDIKKGIVELAKAEAVRFERNRGKKFLIRNLGQDVVKKIYKDKVKYDKSCLRMLNKKSLTMSDLYVGKWKEVLDVCPKRSGAGWNIIYTQMHQKLDDIHKTKKELELDLNRPLEEQDPIIKLNLLAKRKRKNVDDLHDYFKSTKWYNTSVHYGKHSARTVLNEPTLGMILLNAQHKQDFISKSSSDFTKDLEWIILLGILVLFVLLKLTTETRILTSR